MKKTFKKTMAILLVAMMLVTMLPLTAFAETVSETDVSLSDVSVVEASEADTVVEDAETVNSIEEINEDEPEEDSIPLETESINIIDDSVFEDTKQNAVNTNEEKEIISEVDIADEANKTEYNNELPVYSMNEEYRLLYTTLTSKNGSDYTSNSVLASKLTQILNGNIGTIFTDDACTKQASLPLGTKLNNSIKYWIKSGSTNEKPWGMQCFAYANAVYSSLFGDIPEYTLKNSNIATSSNNFSSGSSLRSLFQTNKIKTGAYVRTTGNSDGSYNSSNGHSFIVLTYNTDNITVLEGNQDGNGLITIIRRTWDDFYNFHFKGYGRKLNKIVQPTDSYFSEKYGDSSLTSYPIAEGVYRLKNIATGKYLTVSGNSDSNSTNILVDSNKDASGQRFLVYNYNGNYAFRPECSTTEKVVNVSTPVIAENGNNVILYSRTNDISQLWTLEQAKGDNYGLFYIKSTSNTNVTLNVDGTNVNVSTYSGGNSQLWSFEPVDVVDLGDNFYARIVNYGSKNPIVSRDGNVVLSESRFVNNAIWNFKKSDDGTYLITDIDGKAMDIASAKNEIRTNIQVWTANNNSAQRWMIKKATNGYTLQAKMSDYIMDVDQGYSDDGTNIRTYSANGTEAQTWIIEKGKFEFAPVKSCYYNGSVYSVYEESMMWQEAKDACEAIGGHLATITSQGEQEAIESMLENNVVDAYWLGGTDEKKEGTWEWITGETFSMFNWNEKQPDNNGGNENYLGIYDKKNGKWNDYPVFYSKEKVGFICEIETSTLSPAVTMTYDGKKYELYENRLAWNDAKLFAESKGGHLVTIENANENKAVSDFAAKNGSQYRYWLGGTDYGTSEHEWVTGEDFNYSNWSANEPSHTCGREFYIQMYNNEPEFVNGTWNDYRQFGYLDKGNGFIVEYPVSDYTITYDANGGTNAPESHTFNSGETAAISLITPTRDGYVFVLWNTKSDGSGISYAPGDTYALDADLALYAQWVYTGYKGKCGDDLEWSYEDGVLSITGTGAMYDYDSCAATPWYSVMSDIEEVRFGDGITHIGAYAFNGAENIAKITIPSSITSVGEQAFYTSRSRDDRSVYFTDLSSWCSMIIPDYSATPAYYCKYAYLNGELIEELVIPDDVTEIKDYTLSYLEGVKKVTIPNNVKTIGEGAFFNSYAITDITFSEGLTHIGTGAFVWCCGLKSICIPDSVIDIEEGAFQNCYALETVTIGSGLTQIADNVFSCCRSLTSITIPDSVTSIGYGAFGFCDSLKNITFGNGLTSIAREAFADCRSLVKIRIPDSVTEIGPEAFFSCKSLEHVVLSKKMKSIPWRAFMECENLKTIFVPEEIEDISNDDTFSNCGNFIMYGYKGSCAEKYASKYDNITFVDVNASFLFSASPSNSCLAGSTVTLTASGGTAYKFYYECNGTWVRLQDTGSDNTYTWKPTAAGKYNLYCDITTAEGALICKIIWYTVNINGSISVSPTEGIRADSPVTLTASGGNTYKFYYNYGNSWVRIQDTSEKNTCSWIPPKPGKYTIYCDITASGGLSACEKINLTVGESEKYTAYLKFAYASPQKAGTTIKLTASATGGKGALKYKFYSECNGVWTKLWDYDTRDTYNWHATTVGTHTVYCDVMDEEGNVACAVVKYEIVKGEDFVADLNANRISGQLVGTEIRLLGGSSNGTGTVKYKFYYEIDGNWVRLADYSTQDYFLWTPTKPGYYNLYMDAQDSAGNTASKRLCITIDEGQTLKVTSVTFNPTTGKTGSPTTITAKSTGGSGTVTYKFYYEMNGSWVKMQDFSEKAICTWTPTKAGTYHIYVDAIDGTKNTQCLMVNYIVK